MWKNVKVKLKKSGREERRDSDMIQKYSGHIGQIEEMDTITKWCA